MNSDFEILQTKFRHKIKIIEEHGIEPLIDFTAADGKEFGYVAAWKMDGGYLIQYGNDAGTYYDYSEDADDLAAWLESQDLNTLDTLLQTATVRGIDAVEAADKNADGPFYIIITRYWYNPAGCPELTETSTYLVDNREQPIAFQAYQCAQDWIKNEENNGYARSHNERFRPDYTIVSENRRALCGNT